MTTVEELQNICVQLTDRVEALEEEKSSSDLRLVMVQEERDALQSERDALVLELSVATRQSEAVPRLQKEVEEYQQTLSSLQAQLERAEQTKSSVEETNNGMAAVIADHHSSIDAMRTREEAAHAKAVECRLAVVRLEERAAQLEALLEESESQREREAEKYKAYYFQQERHCEQLEALLKKREAQATSPAVTVPLLERIAQLEALVEERTGVEDDPSSDDEEVCQLSLTEATPDTLDSLRGERDFLRGRLAEMKARMRQMKRQTSAPLTHPAPQESDEEPEVSAVPSPPSEHPKERKEPKKKDRLPWGRK
ncbi:hypothetical protein AGDE_13930 [Angomonas deanei]|uniref:Uncharacterized protein n=1 Tax=Angomonas deanei TaxID=59799 RepID=A0A7G2CKU1_9TRYP|nr:hypothetical protein AGDE_13930 [Angomonas deanei]CAD2220039.1 hypothetical protein, conserved [Angomonas deanei]|eukprot:EPY21597.1 hypothetical protein AGDE_13930 [Angomonas deanei]